MEKVLVATEKPFAKEAIDGIRSIVEASGMELSLLEKYTSHESLYEALKDAVAVIIRSDNIDAAALAAAPNLKIVVRAGAGYDNVDLQAATDKGVVVMNTPGQNSNAVAELAIGMMLFLARNGYNGKSGTELRGKSLGIHAFGNVGRLVNQIAKGFGIKVYAFDPFVDNAVMEAEGVVPLSTVEELYSTCQYISLHIPANAETKASVNYNLLSKLPLGGTVINTARKEVIHEDDLQKIMDERADIKYASDIAPDCKDVFPEKYEGRYFFTPKKMGAQTAEANINAGIAAANQIVGFLKTGITKFKVN